MDREERELTEDQIRKVEKFWEDPQKILDLIDLIFLCEDPEKRQVCS